MVQLSHLHMTTGKTIALTIQTFVRKAMFLIFNTLSKFVIAFLPSFSSTLMAESEEPLDESERGMKKLA